MARLYDRYSGAVFALVNRMLQNREDAEDVLQHVFMQVWRKAATFDETQCTPFTWLVMIARSRAIDRLRQRSRQAKLVDDAEREIPAAAVAPPIGADEMFQQELRTAVVAALRRIPVEQRQAIEMAFFSGMSQAEISNALAEPLGTVKARIRRGMMKLREYLATGL